MKLEIDFGKTVRKAREVVNSLIEGAEDTKISVEVKRESRTGSEEEADE